MLAPDVPKPKAPPKAPSDPGLIQTAFRLPPELLERLDAWVDELNESRPWPKMTRSDLVRIVLSRAADERPDLDGK